MTAAVVVVVVAAAAAAAAAADDDDDDDDDCDDDDNDAVWRRSVSSVSSIRFHRRAGLHDKRFARRVDSLYRAGNIC